MINLVITAGGTSENIDSVRRITNTSTGALGVHLCQEAIRSFRRQNVNFKIYYIVTKTAIKPVIPEAEKDQVVFYEVTDTQSVETILCSVFNQAKIHGVIHSMAISDYQVSYTVSINALVREISEKITVDKMNQEAIIEKVLKGPESRIKNAKKIPSGSEVMIGLKPTKKIIGQIKAYDPNVYLVGFKLLNGVEDKVLIEAATQLMHKNGCDMVIANDLVKIHGHVHRALMIRGGKVIKVCHTKKEIAECLMKEMVPVLLKRTSIK